VIHDKGFGAEVSKAIVAREEWLIATRHAAAEQPGMITPKPDILRELNQRAVTLAVEKLAIEFGLPHAPRIDGLHITGEHVGTIDLPTQRLAAIKGREEFALVPWRPELLKMRGREIEIGVHDRSITMALARGRSRNLGLPR
jgi:Protein of unknown function (DUF3363)